MVSARMQRTHSWQHGKFPLRLEHAAHFRAQVAEPNSPTEKVEERDEVTFGGPVDSVYLGASKDYVELDVGTGAAVAISSSGWEDVVVVRGSREYSCGWSCGWPSARQEIQQTGEQGLSCFIMQQLLIISLAMGKSMTLHLEMPIIRGAACAHDGRMG